MYSKETNVAENRELTDGELAGITGGFDKFFIIALASPAPYDPKDPAYSGYGHVIGTSPKSSNASGEAVRLGRPLI